MLVSLYIDGFYGLPQLIPYPFNLIVGLLIMINGFFWGIWSNVELYKRGEGSPIPLKDTQTIKVVISGPYKYCRNPMIFGYMLIWIGLGLMFNSFFLTIGFTLIITLLLIIAVKFWEEKDLEKRLGNDYIEYKKDVSFIIPWIKKERNL